MNSIIWTDTFLIIQDSAYGSFQAAVCAAKDCQAPVSSTIQGTRGCIRISVPMNQIESYELIDNQKYRGRRLTRERETHLPAKISSA